MVKICKLFNINIILILRIAFLVFFSLVILDYMNHRTMHKTLRSSKVISQHVIKPATSSVIFLVRTYSNHFDLSNPFNIATMLHSIQNQEYHEWIAYLINTDTNPLPLENHPVQKMMNNDHRIQLFDVSVYRKYDKWVAGYDITDAAIARLPVTLSNNMSYIIITNGDNIYEPNFISSMNISLEYDVYYTDYWSRYDRPTGSISPINMTASKCHTGRLERGYIDLGGVALSLKKFYDHGIKFMDYGAINSQDGIMFSDIACHGWKAKHVPICAFSHAPNPYSCYKLGGVWYNSPATMDEVSSSCLPISASIQRMTTINSTLSLSATGIPVLSLSEPAHSNNQRELHKSLVEFSKEFMAKMKLKRSKYCARMMESGYQLNTTDYQRHSYDLAALNLSRVMLVDHFKRTGCIELRLLSNPPPGYFTATGFMSKLTMKEMMDKILKDSE